MIAFESLKNAAFTGQFWRTLNMHFKSVTERLCIEVLYGLLERKWQFLEHIEPVLILLYFMS